MLHHSLLPPYLAVFTAVLSLLSSVHALPESTVALQKRQTVYDTNIVEIDTEAESHSRDFFKFLTVCHIPSNHASHRIAVTDIMLYDRDRILTLQDGMSKSTIPMPFRPAIGSWDRTRVLARRSVEVDG